MVSGGVVEAERSNTYDVNSLSGQQCNLLISLSDLLRTTLSDPQSSEVIKFVHEVWPVSRKHVSAELRDYHFVRDELSCFSEGCLARGERAVIPYPLGYQVLKLAHEGHPGVVKTKQRCRDTVWWPGIDRDIERLTRGWESCVLSGKSAQPTISPLQPFSYPVGPWRRIGIDILVASRLRLIIRSLS
jgi:hypothetical protein